MRADFGPSWRRETVGDRGPRVDAPPALEEAIRCGGSAGRRARGIGERTRRPPARSPPPAAGSRLHACGALRAPQDALASPRRPGRARRPTWRRSRPSRSASPSCLDAARDDHRRPLACVGRRIWTRRVGELETELAADQRQARSGGADPAQRPANPHRLGSAGRRADDRRRFRALRPNRRCRRACSTSPPGSTRPRRPERRRRWSGSSTRGEAFVCRRWSACAGAISKSIGRPVSGSAVMRIRDVSGERLEVARLREQFAEAEARRSTASRLALETADMPAWARDAEGRIVWCNAPYARAVEAPDDRGGDRAIGGELFDPARAPRSGGGGQGERRLEAPRRRGRRRRAPDLRRRRGRAPPVGSAGVAHDVSEIAALKARDGAQRGRLFAHDRPAVDRGRDLRQVEAADLLQCRLPADLVARARPSSTAADRRRNPRPAARQAPTARAGGFPRLEGAAD